MTRVGFSRNRQICRFHLAGRCRKGEECRFRHEGPNNVVPSIFDDNAAHVDAMDGHSEGAGFTRLSRNSNGFTVLESPFDETTEYVQGSGKDERTIIGKKRKACIFYSNGYCKWGSNCRFNHTDEGNLHSRDGYHNSNTSQEELHTEPISCCSFSAKCTAGENNLGASSLEHVKEQAEMRSKDVDEPECCICFTNPANNDESNGKFGLLHNCDHIFCLNCIMKWRTSGSRDEYDDASECAYRRCPICRRKSNFVVSSKVALEGEERKSFIENFLARASKTPCRNWQRTGNCRLGHLCFYSHLRSNGSDAKPSQKRQWESRREQRRRRRIREGARVLEVLFQLTRTLLPMQNEPNDVDVYYLEELSWLQWQLMMHLGRLIE